MCYEVLEVYNVGTSSVDSSSGFVGSSSGFVGNSSGFESNVGTSSVDSSSGFEHHEGSFGRFVHIGGGLIGHAGQTGFIGGLGHTGFIGHVGHFGFYYTPVATTLERYLDQKRVVIVLVLLTETVFPVAASRSNGIAHDHLSLTLAAPN
jgi:hypothetical protein